MKNIDRLEQAKDSLKCVIDIKENINNGGKLIWDKDRCFTKFNLVIKYDKEIQNNIITLLKQTNLLLGPIRKELYELNLISLIDINAFNYLQKVIENTREINIDDLCAFIETGMIGVVHNKLSNIIEVYKMCTK